MRQHLFIFTSARKCSNCNRIQLSLLIWIALILTITYRRHSYIHDWCTLFYRFNDDTTNIKPVLEKIHVFLREKTWRLAREIKACAYHCVEKHSSSDVKIGRGVVQTVKQTLERYRSSDLLVQRSLCHVDWSNNASENAEWRSSTVERALSTDRSSRRTTESPCGSIRPGAIHGVHAASFEGTPSDRRSPRR